VVVAAVVFIAMSVHQLVQARLARARSLDAAMANRLRRAFGVDALLGVLVIGLTAWMLQFTPSNVEAEPTTSSNQVIEPINDPRSGIRLDVILTPGKVGKNRLVVKVYEPEVDLRGLEVTFVPPPNDKIGAISQSIPLTGRGMAHMVKGDSITFPVAGTWTLEVSASTEQGSITKAGGSFDIRTRRGEILRPSSNATTTTSGPRRTTTTAESTETTESD
jgi:hypothetical protein